MEVYRIPLVGLRKTCVPVAIGLARAFSQTRNLAAGSGKSVFWYVVSVWAASSLDSELILRQLLRHSRHYGRLRGRISHYGLLLF